jgi:hypothetical protein
MRKKIFVILSSDTEPDRNFFCSSSSKWPFQFLGIKQGVLELSNILNRHRDSHGNTAKMCWLLQCDEFIKYHFGSSSYLCEEFRSLWDGLVKQGHEVGWYPHLWRYKGKKFVFEGEDDKWIKNMLTASCSTFSKYYEVFTAKSGWCFHNNFTLKLFSDLGVKIDLSAMPDLYTKNVLKEKLKSFFYGYQLPVIDWRGANRKPYIPSKRDYRIGIEYTSYNNHLLEIPTTSVVKEASGKFINFVLNLDFNLLRFLINSVIEEAKNEEIVVLSGYIHPDEIVFDSGTCSRLCKMLFRKRSFENLNLVLTYLRENAKRNDIEIEYITPCGFYKKYN